MSGADRIDVVKTGKLYIGGASPRSESGRTFTIEDAKGRVYARMAQASRKDTRDAIEAARAKGLPKWSGSTAYLRGQVLYRFAEMIESRSEDLAGDLQRTGSTAAAARKEVAASVDRMVSLAGWCDKLDQLLGCRNPVTGPYHNHTVPQARGVIGVVTPAQPRLLGLISMVGLILVPGNAVVAIVPREAALQAITLGEMLAVSDMPAGAVNLLTGDVDELLEHLGAHGDVRAVLGAGLSKGQRADLRRAAADSVLRPVHCVKFAGDDWVKDAVVSSPWMLDLVVDHKTIWHPASP